MERDSTEWHVPQWPCDFNSHAHVERDTRFTALALYYTNFNSHAHVERDETVQKSIHCLKNFNSHAHVERDQVSACPCRQRFQISTHTLTWSVTHILHLAVLWKLFQLTRSRGAWHKNTKHHANKQRFQLTRSRGAWLVANPILGSKNVISTHTLTWSVTCRHICVTMVL